MTTRSPHPISPADRAAGTEDPLKRVRRRLRVVRRVGRTLLAVNAASRFFAIGLLCTAALVLLDYMLRFPMPARCVLLAGLLVAGIVGYARLLRPIARYRPPLTDIAARVERWLAERGDAARSTLSAGVGLRVTARDDALTRALARLASIEIAGLFPRVPWGMMRWRPATLATLSLIGLAIGAAAIINAAPSLSTIGLTRLYMPWSDAEWPRLTTIADATPDAVHPSDAPLPLRATLLKSNRPEGEARVTATYRVVGPRVQDGSIVESILVPQPSASASADGRVSTNELYERLIDPARWRMKDGTPTPNPPEGSTGERFVEYTIRSEDDTTATRRIRIVDPPVLVGAAVKINLPAYARDAVEPDVKSGDDAHANWVSGERAVETADAVVGPVLSGSDVTLRLTYSKPVSPEPAAIPEETNVRADGRTVELKFTPRATEGLELIARGGDGFTTREPFRARLSVVADRPPTATIMEPGGARAVLPSAVVAVNARGEDDLALRSFRIEYRLAQPDAESLSAEPKPSGDPVTLIGWDPSGLPAHSRRNAVLIADLSIETTGARPGDEIWLTALAADTFELDDAMHEPVRSTPRRLRVIEESRFIELIQDELEGIRRTAITLDERQGEIMRDGAALKDDPESTEATADSLARRQAEVARRLRIQSDALRGIRERIDENRLDDETARALVQTSERLAESAAEQADRAAGQAAEQASGEPQSDPSESQQRVRDELADLIDRLDRGQDDWVVRRAIERLAETQRALRDETARAGEQTVGRDLDELTPDERTALERIADRQRELAEQAQQAIDDLAERADELRESDPTQAAALDQAAREARRSELAEAISQAAEQVSRNQTGTATDLQEQSIEDLESILEGLENAQRLRDQALRRELASLIQSIESLIRQQRGVVESIEADPGAASPQAERVRTNTLAAAASAGGFDEVGPVLDLLDRAATAQLGSVRALRARPVEIESAKGKASEALARLEEALAEAKRQDDNAAQREQERQRRELVDAYRSALESQSTIRDRTSAIDPDRLTRRDQAELRTIGREQESLRVEIAAIPESHELPTGGITDLYHERIDSAIGEAVRRLGRGQTDDSVVGSQDRAVAMLRAIVDVLSPAQDEQDPFDDQQAGGGGGGNGGGGQEQPAIGELEEHRLLRSLQEFVLDETRLASGNNGAPSPDLAAMQARIAEQARRIIESMQGGGANPPTPDSDETDQTDPTDIEPDEDPEPGDAADGKPTEDSDG